MLSVIGTMSVFGWLVLGLAAGLIANFTVRKSGDSVTVNIMLGMCGALFGGWMFHELGFAGEAEFNIRSMVLATVVASIVLIIAQRVRGPVART